MFEKANLVKMDGTVYFDTLSGKHGCFAEEELKKLLIEFKLAGVPFYLTEEIKIVKMVI